MLRALNKKSVLISSLISMIFMFSIVMFYANPQIDGGNGNSLLELQLSFDKKTGMEIINRWGASGSDHFRQLIFTDYFYAVSYAFFFASVLSILIVKKGKEGLLVYRFAVYLAFIAGLLDWLENTMELFFVNNPSGFPSVLFFFHSVVASAKWAALPIAAGYIAVLMAMKDKPQVQIRQTGIPATSGAQAE